MPQQSRFPKSILVYTCEKQSMKVRLLEYGLEFLILQLVEL